MDFFDFLTMMGGLALFLYGMNMLGDGLAKLSGSKFESVLEKLTNNPFKAVLMGLGVTAVIQSSSATTVMVVGFVNSGIMKLEQAVGIIMGANIGTTVTAWILGATGIDSSSFIVRMCKPTSFSPILAMIGIGFLMFSKKDKLKNIAVILIGFAVLMFGMDTMSSAVKPLADVPEFTGILTSFSNPILGMLAGLVLTAVIQSSSASVGILQALCTTGAVGYSAAIPIIMGQNIGTCVTALLSSIGANRNAKRTAMIHLYFNIIGTIVFMLAFYAVQLLFGIPFWSDTMSATSISIFHSVFNVVTTILLLPFSKMLIWLANKTLRDKSNVEDNPFGLLDSRFFSTPPIAISNAKKAMVDMCGIARENVAYCRKMLKTEDASLSDACKENEDKLDKYEIRLSAYLTQVSELPLSEGDSERVAGYFHMVTNIERIGDYCDNIRESTERMLDAKVSFTDKAKHDLNVMLSAIEEITDMTFEAFSLCDPVLTKKIEPLEEVIDGLQEQLESEHMRRLKAKECNVEAGVIYLEIISNAERIADHCSNIAVAILQAQRNSGVSNRHEYLRKLHAKMPGTYKQDYDMYKEKYSLV